MKKANILRLLALMLALVMVLACFAGCDDSGNTGSDKDDEDETEKVEDLRDGLKKHKFNGMTVYLSKDFDEDDDYENRWTDGDITVEVETAPLSVFGEDISSAKDLRDYMAESFEEEMDEKADTGKANGVPYLIAEYDGETAVMGMYVKGNTLGMICVISEDFDEYEDDMILYATLGELKDYYEDYNEDEDYDEDEGQAETARPVESVDPGYDDDYDYDEPVDPDYDYDYDEPVDPDYDDSYVETDLIELAGLKLDMGETCQVRYYEDSAYVFYGTSITIDIYVYDREGYSAEEWLEEQVELYRQYWDNAEVASYNGVPLIAAEDDDGYVGMTFCYAEGELIWEVSSSGYLDEDDIQFLLDKLSSCYFD